MDAVSNHNSNTRTRRVPSQNTKNNKPKRNAIEEALLHFQSRSPSSNIPGIEAYEKLLAIPLITADYCEVLSQNFQNLVLHLGESVAGDEKLFYFTGKTQDIRLVPHKPQRIGLWFYELCAGLRYGGQFLLFTKLHRNDQYTSVASIVQIWCNIIKKLQEKKTLLTMDSYYMNNEAKQVLEENGVSFVAAFTKNKFNSITQEMEKKVNNPGEWYGIHNPTNRNSIVYHWSREESVGKKWVMTNCAPRTRTNKITRLVPVFSLYKLTFFVCDRFNNSLHGTTWPLRRGGYTRSGGRGAEYNFLFTCILHNTFNCFFDITNRSPSEIDFKQCCLDLADQLFDFAITMTN